jgi:hypothetical protein
MVLRCALRPRGNPGLHGAERPAHPTRRQLAGLGELAALDHTIEGGDGHADHGGDLFLAEDGVGATTGYERQSTVGLRLFASCSHVHSPYRMLLTHDALRKDREAVRARKARFA